MLLSKQQRYTLEIIERLGCVRHRQLEAFLLSAFCRTHPELAPKLTDAVLRQLCYGNVNLRLRDDLVSLPGHTPEPDALEAVDVMLALTEGVPRDFTAAQPKPILLRFTIGGEHSGLFAVLSEASAREIASGLELPPAFNPGERLVILFHGEGRPPSLPVSNTQFFAVRKQEGGYRFLQKI